MSWDDDEREAVARVAALLPAFSDDYLEGLARRMVRRLKLRGEWFGSNTESGNGSAAVPDAHVKVAPPPD